MNTYIALLRGINVGGHKKVPMADLRELLTKSGFKNVQSYIQSGNIILQTSNENAIEIEQKIHKTILKKFGFDVSIIVKTQSELQTIFDACPFISSKKEKSYFMIFEKEPAKELINEMQKVNYENEEFLITKTCIYFYSANGYGRTKFNSNFFERKLKVRSTARNFNTITKLLSLSNN